jgi:ankyrin repeat protein
LRDTFQLEIQKELFSKNPNCEKKMSSVSLALVPTPTVPPPTTSSVPPLPFTTLPWTLADEEALTKRENAITHLQLCNIRLDQRELDLINFRKRYSETVINADRILHSHHIILMHARSKAWFAYRLAYDALKTIEDILWIMAKAGHTQLVAPLMNLSKVTRNCIHLQPLMMNVKWGVNQWTQLHYCAIEGHTSSVKRLLSIRYIDVNARSRQRSTPLHFAAQDGHIEIAQLLIEKGADVNAKVDDGRTPVFRPTQEGHVEIVRLLVHSGADVNARDIDGSTPLHSASIFGHVEIARLLIENGADVNARDNIEWTPLHFAALEGHVEIARLLIENRADVNARTNDGWTPLLLAAQHGHIDILHLLVEFGADLESQANSGYRALHIAVCNCQLSFIQELISKYNVDINARMNDGWTALVLAKMDDEELDDNKLKNKQAIIAFIEANGGIDEDEEEEDD